jgi:hypothetical protein
VELLFFEILASISALGISINSSKVVELIGKLIEKKSAFTQEYSAWEQHTQLPKWLLYLASILEVSITLVEEETET